MLTDADERNFVRMCCGGSRNFRPEGDTARKYYWIQAYH